MSATTQDGSNCTLAPNSGGGATLTCNGDAETLGATITVCVLGQDNVYRSYTYQTPFFIQRIFGKVTALRYSPC